MKNIVIVAHKNLPQPDDDLTLYLSKKNGYRITHIKHSFSDAKDRRSEIVTYSRKRNKKIVNTEKTIDYFTLPEVFIYFKELFFTIKWLMDTKLKYDSYIGLDGLCTCFGLILKRIGICKKVIYWSMDFVPFNRFSQEWKNNIYHTINRLACKNADEVWDLSPRMVEGRKRYFGISSKDYKKHIVVPYAVWNNEIKKVSYQKSQKNSLIFMGHLLQKQGVAMVIKKIPEILESNPNFIFKIIGDGNYKDQLIRLADVLSVGKHCKFLGRLNNNQMVKEIAKTAVSIAPYKKTKDNYSYYADPGKVKTYLACGVPVLLTDLPWNAKDIENNKCGVIIKDDGNDLIEKLIKIMKPEVNKEFRKNAVKYSESYDYEKIFASLDL